MMMRSSSAVHCSLRTAGLSWLCQRSRHCLPMRPLRCDEMNDQLCGPCLMGCQSRGRSVGESRAVRAREDQRRTYACTSLMMSSSSLQGRASVGVDIGDGAYCRNERRRAAALTEDGKDHVLMGPRAFDALGRRGGAGTGHDGHHKGAAALGRSLGLRRLGGAARGGRGICLARGGVHGALTPGRGASQGKAGQRVVVRLAADFFDRRPFSQASFKDGQFTRYPMPLRLRPARAPPIGHLPEGHAADFASEYVGLLHPEAPPQALSSSGHYRTWSCVAWAVSDV